jgi:hypothetical protein
VMLRRWGSASLCWRLLSIKGLRSWFCGGKAPRSSLGRPWWRGSLSIVGAGGAALFLLAGRGGEGEKQFATSSLLPLRGLVL